ncbi:TIR domain-containing protein [Burkholderia sp. AU45388]|uniref:TIR domain-containing protein n=1 Tax=Burkholderia sp. AU45388 TaxID=3059206 RepID=UPI0026571912|nr:TIR domain-containing protein [Burkholderia sp. AU45388]MDN7430538.1 TIR domain-containing protein [Burkholderia sp. AU45388]
MLKVFLSYAKEDRNLVTPYFDRLKNEGFEPWMDCKCLVAGQNWEAEIDRAFNEANTILLFMSPRSVEKRGFVQREANQAIENLRYKQPTDIYAIPVILEKCDVPMQVGKRLQYLDAGSADVWAELIKSLKIAADQQKIVVEKGAAHGPFQIFEREFREVWDARPGHDISISFPRFESVSEPEVAEALSGWFLGRAERVRIQSRQRPWDQMPDLFDGDLGFSHNNGRWDSYSVAFANKNILSLSYTVGWYGAKAAHPNSHFECLNFAFFDGKIYQLSLSDFIVISDESLKVISDLCIKSALREMWNRDGTKADADQEKWISQGLAPNIDNFGNFVISPDGITFLYEPYSIAAYSYGSWSFTVPFYDVAEYLIKDGAFSAVRGI